MYLEFYRLKEFPFALTCDERFFYESAVHSETLANMMYTVQSHKGMVLITGDVGTGKTFLVNMLVTRISGNCVAVNMQNPPQSGKQLIRGLATQLGMRIEPTQDKISLLENIEKHLARAHQRGRLVALLLDEAQDLPDDTLREIRLLANWERNGQRLLQIILVGQPELRNRMLEPQWESFRQRVVLTYNLGHMSKEDVASYIDYRIKVASGEGCLAKFSAQAKEDIYFATQGVPRLINVLCDNALLASYTRKRTEIDHDIMTDVLKEASLWDFGSAPAAAAQPQPAVEKIEKTPMPSDEAAEPVFVHMDENAPPPPPPSSSDEVINLKDIEEELDRASQGMTSGDLPSLAERSPLHEPSGEDDETVDLQPGRYVVTPPKSVDVPKRTPIYELSQDHITPQGVLSAMSARMPSVRQGSIDQIDNKLHMSELLVAHKDRGGQVTEEFRALRTALLATSPDERFCYLITSPESGDGKTLTCLNLALVMIERLDYKTVVVDCDLRKGAISRYLKGRRSPGAAEVLRGAATIKDVTQPTAYPNMFFIPAGKAHPNEVGELVGGPDLMEFVTDLRRMYDYVIIDTPPINSFSDVGMLGLATGEALLVVRMNRTHRSSVLKSIRLLNAANVKLAGLVLTDRKHFLPSNVYRY